MAAVLGNRKLINLITAQRLIGTLVTHVIHPQTKTLRPRSL